MCWVAGLLGCLAVLWRENWTVDTTSYIQTHSHIFPSCLTSLTCLSIDKAGGNSQEEEEEEEEGGVKMLLL